MNTQKTSGYFIAKELNGVLTKVSKVFSNVSKANEVLAEMNQRGHVFTVYHTDDVTFNPDQAIHYVSVRNGRKGVVVSQNEEVTALEMIDTNEYVEVKASTLKRWWKLQPNRIYCEDAYVETEEKEVAKPEKVKTPKPAKQPKESKPKVKKEKSAPAEKNGDALTEYVISVAKELGTEVYKPENGNFHMLKKDGRGYMIFNSTSKGVSLGLRKEASVGIKGYQFKSANHTYDSRVIVNDNTVESRYFIKLCIESALNNFEVRKQRKEVK